jgi:GDP-L-fucose synthase
MTDIRFPLAGKRVWVAGHRGMVGAALLRRLSRENCVLLTIDRTELDLRDQEAVAAWMSATRPDAIFLAAAKVGGILANDSRPADFIYDNLMIAANVIGAAHRNDVEKLLFLGSSCIYPRLAPQPIPERALLAGPLEMTNEFYAIAKIAGIKLCQAYRRQFGRDFIAAMPTNLYGPGDNYDLESSHVLPALLRKAHVAKATGEERLVVWGSGKARREFLHADDCADALVHVMQRYSDEAPINIGCGADVSISDLAELIMHIVGLEGRIVLDTDKPDGTPRKMLDCERLTTLGWRPSIPLEAGIRMTYAAAPFDTMPA